MDSNKAEDAPLTDEEVYKINTSNLGNLITNIFPNGVFLLAIIPNRDGKGMLATHNIHLDNYEVFIKSADSLAKSMCEAQAAIVDPNRIVN